MMIVLSVRFFSFIRSSAVGTVIVERFEKNVDELGKEKMKMEVLLFCGGFK